MLHTNFKECHPRCVCNSLGERRIVKTTQHTKISADCATTNTKNAHIICEQNVEYFKCSTQL